MLRKINAGFVLSRLRFDDVPLWKVLKKRLKDFLRYRYANLS